VQDKICQLYTELLSVVLGVPLLNLRFALGTRLLTILRYPLCGNMELHMFAIMIKELSTTLLIISLCPANRNRNYGKS
jgi:hypothetical protein